MSLRTENTGESNAWLILIKLSHVRVTGSQLHASWTTGDKAIFMKTSFLNNGSCCRPQNILVRQKKCFSAKEIIVAFEILGFNGKLCKLCEVLPCVAVVYNICSLVHECKKHQRKLHRCSLHSHHEAFLNTEHGFCCKSRIRSQSLDWISCFCDLSQGTLHQLLSRCCCIDIRSLAYFLHLILGIAIDFIAAEVTDLCRLYSGITV